uniref:Terpene synthase metal-binding domain-containing protein n=1 Tax=Oryza brachyantha TaxID=4533 RepID=J3LVN5_ORYBR
MATYKQKGVSDKLFRKNPVKLDETEANMGRYCNRWILGDLIHDNHMENIAALKKMLSEENSRTQAMITVDSLKRLSIDHYFSEQINTHLESFYRSHKAFLETDFGVFDAALSFTSLREGRYDVSSDMFRKFIDKDGEFDKAISRDIKGLLKLHDASHLNMGEEVLHKAHGFTSKQLWSSLNYFEPSMSNFIREDLVHPYHLSLPKYRVKHNLKYFQGMLGRNHAMEELALAEYHHNRSQHQIELMQFTRWWRDLGLAQELPFARDQVQKWYMWAMSIIQPGVGSSKYRLEITKVISFIYVVDDIFDLVGSPDELSVFTDVVKRWDIDEDTNSLPSYMRTCYQALYNVTTDMAELVEKEHGYNPIQHFRKAWEKLFEAFFVETRWFANNQTPTTSDYLKNGVISTGVHVVLVHAFFLLGQGVTRDAVDLLEHNPPIITSCAKILRLSDDLGCAKDEEQHGYDGSYQDCYMNENPSCSSHDAKKHIMYMISKTWEELNTECFCTKSFSPVFQEVSLNLARMVRVMYTYNEKQKLPILEEYVNSLL